MTKREAALKAIDQFCAARGWSVPELEERDMGLTIMFVGKTPDGREFGLGYEPATPASG